MNTSKVSSNTVRTILLALSCCVGGGLAHAEDVLPSEVQSDANISVWVDNASLDFFVSQLALITGRDAAIQGELQGQISGRFNGSMVDTLKTVEDQFPVLFDLDDKVLGVVAETGRSSASIALGKATLDDQMKASLLNDLLPGNELDINDDEVTISGHPSFVSRLAKELISVVARSEPKVAQQISVATEGMEPSVSALQTVDSVLDAEVKPLETVIDSAAQAILDDAIKEIEASKASETVSIAESSPKQIRWVTDIPGYETF
ncbi:MAG: hypothetical protein AB8B87_19140 [Granulosicoccus sp.]